MGEAEKRLRRCCFTGHRPEKLRNSEHAIREALAEAIAAAICDGYTTFITGMARGVDLWAAEAVLACRERMPDIRIICALPHPKFEARWAEAQREQYRRILACADLVRTICPAFSMRSYQARNEWMVDHASRLIAVYNGAPGGTRNTIQYAQRKGLQICYIEMNHEREAIGGDTRD